jgi:hypothetical protein
LGQVVGQLVGNKAGKLACGARIEFLLLNQERMVLVLPGFMEVAANMTTRSMVALYLVVTVVGLVAGLTTAVEAQHGATTGKGISGDPMVLHSSQANKTGARKTSKRTSPKPRTAVTQPRVQTPPEKQWSLEDALPTRRTDASVKREIPTITSPQLGRIPLESGSFGFETETKVKSNELSDGRRVPGLETVKRDPPSYFANSAAVGTGVIT